jgi:hypothetical protein
LVFCQEKLSTINQKETMQRSRRERPPEPDAAAMQQQDRRERLLPRAAGEPGEASRRNGITRNEKGSVL